MNPHNNKQRNSVQLSSIPLKCSESPFSTPLTPVLSPETIDDVTDRKQVSAHEPLNEPNINWTESTFCPPQRSTRQLGVSSTGQLTAKTTISSSSEDIATKALLQSIGLSEYAKLFTQHRISIHMLKNLSSAELRDDLGIQPLRHRRKLISAVQPKRYLPEFGRILVVLSAERTMHSWLANGIQCAILAGGIVRLSPVFRSSTQASICAVIVTVVGMFGALWGGCRFFRNVNNFQKGHRFEVDHFGVGLAFVGWIIVATSCVYLVLAEGFKWE